MNDLRKSFNANLKANFSNFPNMQCCDNDNLAVAETSTGCLMRKLAKNWEACLSRVCQSPGGHHLVMRRPSEDSTESGESGGGGGAGGRAEGGGVSSAGSSRSTDSSGQREPWKPY